MAWSYQETQWNVNTLAVVFNFEAVWTDRTDANKIQAHELRF